MAERYCEWEIVPWKQPKPRATWLLVLPDNTRAGTHTLYVCDACYQHVRGYGLEERLEAARG